MTSCKEAIKDIEVDGKVAAEMEEVRLCPIAMMKPLITKMDNSLSGLKKCKQLRMSSNSIQKIEGLAGMDSLQVWQRREQNQNVWIRARRWRGRLSSASMGDAMPQRKVEAARGRRALSQVQRGRAQALR